jgi:hypothetical protein
MAQKRKVQDAFGKTGGMSELLHDGQNITNIFQANSAHLLQLVSQNRTRRSP